MDIGEFFARQNDIPLIYDSASPSRRPRLGDPVITTNLGIHFLIATQSYST